MSENQNGTYPTKEQIQAASQTALSEHVDVHVKEWGLTVPVCKLTAGEHWSYQAGIAKYRQKIEQTGGRRGSQKSESEVDFAMERVEVLACYLSMKNPTSGARIFSSEQEVAKLSAKGLHEVYQAFTELNGLGEEAEELAGEDFGEIQTGISPTSSAGS